MKIKFGKMIVKHKWTIFIISIVLLIPSIIGYVNTGINYDLLSYLPEEIETMKGQDILIDEFGTGAFSCFVVEGLDEKSTLAIKEDIEQVSGVKRILWYDAVTDLTVTLEVFTENIQIIFKSDEATMMMIIFEDGTSGEETLKAVDKIREIADEHCFLSGMSAVVTDTKYLTETETPIYVAIAAGLSCLVLGVIMESFMIPVLFLLAIGMSVVYNLGTNVFMGEISYITKALAAVLQLAVTMDYAIFLWNSYKEQQIRFDGDKPRAMSHAISNTISSVVGSSVTTVAGFVALCFMSFKLGIDLGIVMAKGVVFGVIICITVLPAMILIFDKAIEKTRHKALTPNLEWVSNIVVKHYWIFAILFVVILFPAIYGNNRTPVYYNISDTLPMSLESTQANKKLEDNFSMSSTHVVMIDSNISSKEKREMLDKIEKLDGVEWALGLESIVGPTFPESLVPDEVKEILKDENYELYFVSSEYKVASDEVNNQCEQINTIIKQYDSNAMLVGEAPCTKDLISVTDNDFKTVNTVSIIAIAIIIALVFKSISLPVILVAVIEFAIFINMGIPYYTNTELPFIASIVIGTIQLGATVDYAILMTTRYKKERYKGASRKEAVMISHKASIASVIGSALSFFAATFGVGMYSQIDMIGSLCILMSRGAIVSMFVVIFILPSMLLIFDRLIIYTSLGFRIKEELKEKKEIAVN